MRAIGFVLNDWQLSGIWSAATSRTARRTPSAQSYQNGGSNVNLTGSPDFGTRISVVGDPG